MQKDNTRIVGLTLLLLGLVAYVLWTGLLDRGSGQQVRYRINKVGENGCCKICRKGIACGTACIPRAVPCEIKIGCACNYREEISSEASDAR